MPDVYHSCKVHYYYESVQVHGGDVDKKVLRYYGAFWLNWSIPMFCGYLIVFNDLRSWVLPNLELCVCVCMCVCVFFFNFL